MSPLPRILLVEDDPQQASLFADVLERVGNEVRTAYDAEEAITQISEHEFDLTLVDWDLPGMKGDDFILLVKAEYPNVKTVLYSNHSDVDKAATACNADAWMRKTDGIVRLRTVVTEVLKPA